MAIWGATLIVFTVGLTFLTYTLAVLLGGGGNPGEEDVMLGQIFFGILLVLLVHFSGVLY